MADANKVSVGKPKVGGAIFRAPAGSDLPTDATSELGAAFQALGYAGDSGLVNKNSPESGEIKAWGGDVVCTYQSGKKDMFKFVMIEALNVQVLKAVYGDENVTGDLDTGITVKANSKEQAACAWVIDMILRGGVLKRIVIPSAAVTEVEDVTYADESVVGYGTTLTATPDGDGQTHYEYIKAPAAAG